MTGNIIELNLILLGKLIQYILLNEIIYYNIKTSLEGGKEVQAEQEKLKTMFDWVTWSHLKSLKSLRHNIFS